MVATVGAVHVAAGAHALLGTAAKFAKRNDERFLKQSARFHVLQECGEALVEHRRGLILHAVRETHVHVP